MSDNKVSRTHIPRPIELLRHIQASKAHQYLQHMASTPNFQQQLISKKWRGKIPRPGQSSHHLDNWMQSSRTVLLDDSDAERDDNELKFFGKRGIGDEEETSSTIAS